MRLLNQVYQFGWGVRKSLLYSLFGYMSHCKHSPSCGSYFLDTVRKEGFVQGLRKGIWRAITCF